MKKKKKPALWILIYLVAVAICILFIYIVPSVMGWFDTTYIAEHGSIEVSDDVEAYIIRDDKVFTAENSATINQLAEEGQLIKGYSKVLELTGSGNDEVSEKYKPILDSLGDNKQATADGISDKAGYVSYYIDGRESVFSVENLDKLTKQKADSYESYGLTETPSQRCAANEPLFKVSTNGDWYLLFWVDNTAGKRYIPGHRVTIAIGESTVYADVTKSESGKNMTRVELRSNMFIKKLLQERKTAAKITTDESSGALIEVSSIVTKDKIQGVIVKDKIGKNHFKPIQIKATDGDKAVVCEDFFMDENQNFVETVMTYDEIVKSPSEEEIKEAVNINDKYN